MQNCINRKISVDFAKTLCLIIPYGNADNSPEEGT